MLPALQLRAVLPTLPRVAMSPPWYRAVSDDLLQGPPPGAAPGTPPQPLWPGGPSIRGSRFTPAAPPLGARPPIDALYLAGDELTPLVEIAGVLRPPGSAVPLYFPPQVMLTVVGALDDVLDLTDTSIQRALGTTASQLTAPWIPAQSAYLSGTGPMPPTQELGEEAFNSGVIAGLRYRSSKNPAGFGLVVFTPRIVRGRHFVAVHNRLTGRLQQRL